MWCRHSRPLTWKVIKSFRFWLTVLAWPGSNFDHVNMNNNILITLIYTSQYASNFTCWSVVVKLYVCHWSRKWAGQIDLLVPCKLQPQGPLWCTWMKFGGYMRYTHIYKVSPRNFIGFSWKLLCVLPTHLRLKAMKIFCFGVTVWAPLRGAAILSISSWTAESVTSKYIVLYAPNLAYLTRVPAWTHLHAIFQSWSWRHLLVTANYMICTRIYNF